jgi:hypothetical protein
MLPFVPEYFFFIFQSELLNLINLPNANILLFSYCWPGTILETEGVWAKAYKNHNTKPPKFDK